MRIAFVGLPLAALLLAEDGHEIVWAGICRKGAAGTRRLARRIGRERVAIVPELARAAPRVADERPELVVSWFWTRNVPRAFRAIAPLGAIGVHPSLLPRHRGPDPYFWAIDSGDEVTGVTAHALEDEYDTGAILAQRELRIDPSWSAWRLAKRLDRPSLSLLREVVGAYAAGRAPAPRAQDESKATAAPQPTDDELELRWSEPAARIERRVRAASPWPGAFTEIGGEVVTLTRVRATGEHPRVLEAGQAFVRKDGIAIVRAGDGAVELLRGRVEDDGACGADPAGDAERELDARALADLVTRARLAGT